MTALIFGAGAQASHGPDQLELSLGVEPNVYSLPQLSLLKALRDDDNASQYRIDNILEHPEGPQGDLKTDHRTELDRNAASWRSLTISLNVEPGRYSPSQLVSLKSAVSDDDQARIAFIKSSRSADGNVDRGQATSGAAQLARSLGVEPGLYSLNQLVRLKTFNDDSGNSSLIRQILENPDFG